MVTGTSNGFLAWFSQWGQVVYFGAQILFWVAIAAAALIIALQYKRFVTHKVDAAPTATKTGDAPVDVLAE